MAGSDGRYGITAHLAPHRGSADVAVTAISGPGGQSTVSAVTPHTRPVWLMGTAGVPWSRTSGALRDPVYTVTETVLARQHTQQVCGANVYLCTAGGWAYLIGVGGAATGQTFTPTSVTCTNPCTTLTMTFSVPSGTYSAQNLLFFKKNSRKQTVEADNPQFAVSGDTSIEFDLNDARHMTIDTGKAIDPYNAVLETYRSLADGTAIDSLVFQSYGNHSYWATPTSPVTIGGFHLKTNWVLAQPLVAADVSSPASLHLDATYPGYRPNEQVRFTGTQTLDIVAAGAGTKSDLEGLDVGGKLALLYPPRNACVVKKFQLQNAEAAGAAGVVIDATNHGNVVGHDCGLTILPYWFFDQRPVVPMPFVEVPGRQASALRALIKQGEVQVTITDNGNTPYEQDVTLVQQGQVPVSLHYRFGPDQQSQTQENYDASTSVIVDHSYTNFLPDEGFVGGTEYNFAGQVSHQVTVAPLSDSIVNDITTTIETSDYQTALEVMSELAVYDTAGDQGEQSWGDVPTQPGVPAPPGDVFIAQPGRWSPFAFCSACRQGNYFLPWTYLTTAQPLEQDQMALPGLDPSTVHLYLGGQEIPPTQNDYGLSEYKLPSRNARYRLTMAYANSTTEWTFDSARPRHDTTPENYACAGAFYFNLTGPCEASPLIFLRYDAHVGLADDVSAPGRHVMDVTAYGQSDTSLHVDQLELWTSIDGGQTWKRAGVTASGDGRFTATYRVGKSSGALSIKTLAADSRGSTVTQTLLDAVGLS